MMRRKEVILVSILALYSAGMVGTIAAAQPYPRATPVPLCDYPKLEYLGPVAPEPDGLGFTDVSPHQLVRNSAPGGGRVFTVAPTCVSPPNYCLGTIRVFRADSVGVPTGFTRLDVSNEPEGDVISSAIAIDATDTIHVLWNTKGGFVYYNTFNADEEGPNEWFLPNATLPPLDDTNWTPINEQDINQGDAGVALAFDSKGILHACWSYREAPGDYPLHIRYANYDPYTKTWSPAIPIDDPDADPDNQRYQSWHPTIALTATDDLIVAWEEGDTRYTNRGAADNGLIRVRTRYADGMWSAPEILKDLEGQNVFVLTGVDQGPSLLITPDGVQHLAAIDGRSNPPSYEHIVYWYNAGAGWMFDQNFSAQPELSTIRTHNPSVGPDGTWGGVWLYGHGDPSEADFGLYRSRKAGGQPYWGGWCQFLSGDYNWGYDAAVGIRWAQNFHHYPGTVDILYWRDPPRRDDALYFATIPEPEPLRSWPEPRSSR